jgi:hypothetical protein
VGDIEYQTKRRVLVVFAVVVLIVVCRALVASFVGGL